MTVLLSFFAYFWYRYVYEIYPSQASQIQRSISFLPYLRMIISILFTYNIYLNIIDDQQSTVAMSMYIEVVMQTLQSIYKTFFLFLLLLISFGWVIFKETITKSELMGFVFFYLAVYVLIFFDPFFDSMLPFNLWGIAFSDIKNMLVLFLLCLLIVHRAKKIYWKFSEKFSYAHQYLPQISAALLLKMGMMWNIIAMAVVYPVVSAVFFISYKSIVTFTNGHFFQTIVELNENFFMLYLLYVFRPREFPQHFSVKINNQDTKQSLCEVILPCIGDIENSNGYNNNINSLQHNKKDIKAPYVIVNPVFNGERMNIIDKISIAYI